ALGGMLADANQLHRDALAALPLKERVDRMCELNACAQVTRLSRTKIIQHAWQRGQEVWLYGWVYGLGDGRIKDLGCSIGGLDEAADFYRITAAAP
ncbi:MAG: carbonic anhydrase, partial [Halomonas sp.]